MQSFRVLIFALCAACGSSERPREVSPGEVLELSPAKRAVSFTVSGPARVLAIQDRRQILMADVGSGKTSLSTPSLEGDSAERIYVVALPPATPAQAAPTDAAGSLRKRTSPTDEPCPEPREPPPRGCPVGFLFRDCTDLCIRCMPCCPPPARQ